MLSRKLATFYASKRRSCCLLIELQLHQVQLTVTLSAVSQKVLKVA